MEPELIDWLRRRVRATPKVALGIGDDAAVLHMADGDCIVTTDMLMDGVHFVLRDVDPRRIGHKSLAINLSDLAAMAAVPVAAVISLALPRQNGLTLAKEFYDGLLPLAESFELAVVGGDTNSWDGPLVVSVTALGTPTSRGPLCRSGARPGDRILVTGRFGGSLLGRHLDPVPRVREALTLHQQYELHAAIDVSDGLALDLSRICRESDCGAEIRLHSIPIHDDAQRWADVVADGRTALEHALGDGEDFELMLAVPPTEAERLLADKPLDVAITCIGEFVKGGGLWAFEEQGQRRELPAEGYRHGST